MAISIIGVGLVLQYMEACVALPAQKREDNLNPLTYTKAS